MSTLFYLFIGALFVYGGIMFVVKWKRGWG